MPASDPLRRPSTLLPLLLALGGCAAVAPPGTAPTSAAAAPAAPAASAGAAPGAGTTSGTTGPAAGSSSAAARPAVPATSAAAAAPMPPPTAGLPPFAVVTKDARQIDGPIIAWQKDDKLWLELAPEQFGKPFMLSPKLDTGIGEAFILGGLMAYPVSGAGGPQIIEFSRINNQVRLLARNTDVRAQPGTPEARAAAVSYSPSLLGSMLVASQPHPQRKSVLVEVNSVFLSDMLGVGMQLQRAFRQPYTLDTRNSSFSSWCRAYMVQV